MSGKTDKQKRMEHKRNIFIHKNKDIILQVVLHDMRSAKLKEKLAFCAIILFRGKG